MPKVVKPLKDTEILNAKPREKDYTVFDGDGLLIVIQPNNKKIWRFKYSHPVTRKARLMTLGKYPEVTLKTARDLRAKYRQMLAEGIDPIEAIAVEKEKKSITFTFESVARQWFAMYGKLKKCNEDTLQRDLRKFENYLFPLIGYIRIDKLTTNIIEQALQTLQDQNGLTETAKKLKGKVTAILAWAVTKQWITFNPAREVSREVIRDWEVKHMAALPLEQLPDLLKRIENYTGKPMTRLAMKLALHLFIRSSELRMARWSEIDFDNKLWTIPATRKKVEGVKFSDRGAKMKAIHLVPLSDQAIELLKEVQQYSGMSDHIFPKENDPTGFLSETTITQALQRMGYDTQEEQSLHGFRTLACSSLTESGLYNPDAVERQMSHKEKNKIRGSYTWRAQFLAERKEMMVFWSNYLQCCYDGFISPLDFARQNKPKNDHESTVSELLNLLKAKYPQLEDDAA
ncbi:MAG: DUF4102 domain-containing protein [Moraxellaceae bacterium]|nr:MAG: DUF4102 domain-containing protein [Moraxellaceae bacterium]